MTKEFNAVVFGELHQVEPKQGKFGDYYKVTIRNKETFKELILTCYEKIDWTTAPRQGEEVQAHVVMEPKGYQFDVKLVDIKTA